MSLPLSEDFNINGILLTGNFSTEKDKALAWSGAGNRELANEFRQMGYQTIEDTQGGKDLNEAIPWEAVERGEIGEAEYNK